MILLDIMLPGRFGTEFARELRNTAARKSSILTIRAMGSQLIDNT